MCGSGQRSRWACSVSFWGLPGVLSNRRSPCPPKSNRHRAVSRPLAQLPVNAQGTSVTVGSTTVPVPWEQRGDRIGIADLPLMTHLGLDLQNSTTADQQPVVWFADEGAFLPTWFN